MKNAKNKLVIYADGGARGNPGPAALGVIIKDVKGSVVKKYSSTIGERTNNEAEYEAVIFALRKVKHIFGKSKIKSLNLEINLDSELVARQLSGFYKVEEKKLFPLFIKAHNLMIDFGRIAFKEVPREENKEADRLLNLALDEKKPQRLFR